MNNRRMKRAITKNLTPKEAWDLYAGSSPEMFISNFYAESNPITDIKEMCRINAYELPANFENANVLFTDEQLELIENLTVEYLENYINEKGGIDNLELISPEELYIMDEIETENLLNDLANYSGIPRKERREIVMEEKIKEIQNELLEIYTEYLLLEDNTYDFKTRILAEQISVLEDILNDELDELFIYWDISLKEDKKDYFKYNLR